MAITDFKSLLGREPVDGDQVRVWRFITSDVEPEPVQQVTLAFRLGLFRADKGYLPPSALFSTKEGAEKAYVAWLLADDVGQYAETTAADVDEFGFIVWRSRPPGSCEYVFRTEPDVLRWRTAAGLDPHPIRRLVVPTGITWRESTGSVRGIWLGDGLYRVYPDRQSYESAENKEGALGQPPAGYMEPA